MAAAHSQGQQLCISMTEECNTSCEAMWRGRTLSWVNETLEWTGLIPRPGVKLGSLGMGLGVRCAGVLLSLASHWVRSVLHTYTVHQGYSILNIQCYGIITHAVAWWTVCMWTQMLVVNATYMGVAAKTVPNQQSWVAYSMNSNCKTYNYRCSCVDKLQAITHVLRLKYAVGMSQTIIY